MSVRLPSDLNSYTNDFERMPPPPVVDIRPRPSDVSTIAGTAAFGAPPQPPQRGVQRIRIFVCLFDPAADVHQEFGRLKSKVCTWNAPSTNSDAALLDLKRTVARKFRAEHLMEEQSACFYLLVKEDAQAHEIDCAEDIQAGDLLGLYLGERYQQPLPPLNDTALDNLTVETPRVTNSVAEEEQQEQPTNSSVGAARAAKERKNKSKAAAAAAAKAPKKKKTPSPKTAATTGRQRKKFTELTQLLKDAGSVTARSPARVLRQTPARLKEEEPPPPKKRKAAEVATKPPPPKKAKTTAAPPADKKASAKKKTTKPITKPKAVAKEPQYLEDFSSSSDNDNEEEEKYGIGKKFFVKDECDGIGGELYPAEVLEVLDNGERVEVGFIGYHEKLNVPVSELQEYTQERLDRYNKVVLPRLEQVDRETAAAEDNSPIECYRVGEDYFVEEGGVEYPVTIKRFSKRKPGQVYIVFKGYRSERYVFQSRLLRATPRRWETYRVKQEITKELEKRKKAMPRSQWRRIKNEELNQSKELKHEEEPVAEEEEEQVNDESDNGEQSLEPATDIDDLPDKQESNRIGHGCYEHQVNRLLYIAAEDETAGEIAEKFQLPIEKLLYDNQRKWKGLKRATNHLKGGTPIVLPVTWKGKEVKMTVTQQGDAPQQQQQEPDPEPSNHENEESESSEMDIGELLEGRSNAKNGDDNASQASSDWTDEDAKISI